MPTACRSPGFKGHTPQSFSPFMCTRALALMASDFPLKLFILAAFHNNPVQALLRLPTQILQSGECSTWWVQTADLRE